MVRALPRLLYRLVREREENGKKWGLMTEMKASRSLLSLREGLAGEKILFYSANRITSSYVHGHNCSLFVSHAQKLWQFFLDLRMSALQAIVCHCYYSDVWPIFHFLREKNVLLGSTLCETTWIGTLFKRLTALPFVVLQSICTRL